MIFGTKQPIFVMNGNFQPFMTFFMHYVPNFFNGCFFIPGLIYLTNIIFMIPGLSGLISLSLVYIPGAPFIVHCVLTIAAAVLNIALCAGILGLQKRAFKIYAGVTCALGLLRIIAYIGIIFAPWVLIQALMPFILKGLLLWVIYKFDGKLFTDGGGAKEPISVIRMRQRQEKEAEAME